MNPTKWASYMKKYSFAICLENGKIVLWTGYAEDKDHAEGLAFSYIMEKYDEQVFDSMSRPIVEKD